MKILQIASSSPAKTKAQEQLENKMLLDLYNKYKEKPFDYAVINYHKDGTANLKVHGKNSFVDSVKNFVKKIGKLFKNFY